MMAGTNTFYASLIYGQLIKRPQPGNQSPLHFKHHPAYGCHCKCWSLDPAAGAQTCSLEERGHICEDTLKSRFSTEISFALFIISFFHGVEYMRARQTHLS